MQAKSFPLNLLFLTLLPSGQVLAQSTAENILVKNGSRIPAIPAPQRIDDQHAEPQSNTREQLFLSITVNTGKASDFISVQQDQKQNLYILAKDLRAIRILLDEAIADEHVLNLNDIPQLSYHYDMQKQSLNISVPIEKLTGHTIDLNRNNVNDEDLLNIKSLNATVLNYRLYNTTSDGHNVFSATGELRYNRRWGNLSSGFLYNDNQETAYSHDPFVRLESKWQYVDPVKIQIYTLGDFASNTTDWGSSVRLAGFQWSSAYAQRTDINTSALPQFSGSAALPSTLDLYVNQQKIYTGSIPSGQFDLKTLPFVSGQNVTLVTTDATGQQTVSQQAYYYSSKILSASLKEFSIDVGVPRFNYSTRSDTYDHIVFASGAIRYGYSNQLTLNSGLESSSNGLVNLGLGLAQATWGHGVVNAAIAGSQFKQNQGMLSLIGFEGRLSPDFSFNMSYQRTFDNYYDLARVSKLRYSQHYSELSDEEEQNYSPFAKQITRLGLSYNLSKGSSFNLSYNEIEQADSAYQLVSASIGKELTKNFNLFSSAYKDVSSADNYGIFLALRYQPTPRLHSSSSINRSANSTTYRQEISGSTHQRIGGLGWGASFEHDNNQYDSASVYLNYKARAAYLSAKYNHLEDIDQTVLSATGALVFASGTVFPANEIGKGYAIINNAGPESQIIKGGVNLGTTDRKGRFLIPNLTPYKRHHIYLDPAYLPLDWMVESTEKSAITAYGQGTLVDFSAQHSFSGVLRLVDKDQQVIKPGYPVKLNHHSESVVGYDGEVFVQHLLQHNILEVDLQEQGHCKVQFPFDAHTSSAQFLGVFVCQ